MKKALLIIAAGVLLGCFGYVCLYSARTSEFVRKVREVQYPELLWLQQEFGLNQEEFGRIRELHEAYLPECRRMCANIAAANSELEAIVLKTNQITPEITAKLADIARLRQDCQTHMLNHFYAVSRSMSPEQGRRYLAHMQKLTSLSNVQDRRDPERHAHAD